MRNVFLMLSKEKPKERPWPPRGHKTRATARNARYVLTEEGPQGGTPLIDEHEKVLKICFDRRRVATSENRKKNGTDGESPSPRKRH